MAREDVSVLFLHGRDDDVLVEVHAGGERRSARLELGETDAGPRPRRFAWRTADDLKPAAPDRFVELARAATRLRISSQTPKSVRERLQAMLAAYQLEATAVRTCPACAARGRYAPITDETAIHTDAGDRCLDCASAQLERELAFHDVAGGAVAERLTGLLERVGDLERVRRLLEGELDPELTKIDEVAATDPDVERVPVEDLDVADELREVLAARFDRLRPVQARAVEAGLLAGEDLLVVSATATGKTLVGEIAGVQRVLEGRGTFLFLVPLVALANQTYRDLEARYGGFLDVSLRVGHSRLRDPPAAFDPTADVIVGTYEGVDHALRTGRDLGDVGAVVVDEVHGIGRGERGARLDGLIARLHDYCERRGGDTQWLYLSATVGNPPELAAALGATLVEYEERPVPIERHLVVATSRRRKVELVDRIVERAWRERSSKGYRGQSIVFTNARRRTHELARTLSVPAAAYHGGLSTKERRSVESRFQDGDLAAVVTTAALGAGVDFPASHVVFESLAMGIEWLSVHEFEQMLGRAGRPDYHDRGVVYLLVEPGGIYHGGMDRTEEAVAFELLEGGVAPVEATYDDETAAEETLANLVVAGTRAKRVNERMVGALDTQRALALLLEAGLIEGLDATGRGRVAVEHFLTPGDVDWLRRQLEGGVDPLDVVARYEVREMQRGS
ncbi:MAG: DEAD/DEAH box helicase [Halobacteriales archaeon]